jgi:cytochrome c biogenesis protein CcdA
VASKPSEATELRVRAETHRENVWLALGSLGFVGGIALVTTTWLAHVTLAAAPPSFHPGFFNEAIEVVFLAVGVVLLIFAGYVFLSFFREVRLWKTLREKQLVALERQQRFLATEKPKGEEPLS